MPVKSLEVSINCCGTIFKEKPFVDFKGEILRLSSLTKRHTSVESSLASYSRIVTACFDESLSILYFADHTGTVYLIDFVSNRYSFIINLGMCCTVLQAHPVNKNLLYVGTVDNAVRIINTAEKKQTRLLKGHCANISAISIQPMRVSRMLTLAPDGAVLWDLETFQTNRRLSTDPINRLTAAFFIPPSGQSLISCLSDGSMFLWDSNSLECIYQLSNSYPSGVRCNHFCTTSDGKYLLSAGKSAFIYIWRLLAISEGRRESLQAIHEIVHLPAHLTVHQMAWVPPLHSLVSPPFDTNKEDSSLSASRGALVVLTNDRRVRVLLRGCEAWRPVARSETEPAAASPWVQVLQMEGQTKVTRFSAPSAAGKPMKPLQRSAANPASSLIAVLHFDGSLRCYDLAQIRSLKAYPIVHKVVDPELCVSLKSKSVENIKKSLSTSRNGVLLRTITDSSTIKKLHSTISNNFPNYLLNHRRLRNLLKEYGHYPSKYRLLIWRCLLQLPENIDQFKELAKKEIHPIFEKLPEDYPIKSHKLMRILQRTCSALTHWSGMFGEADYLPLLAFPFVKLFQSNLMHCFEVVATILMNWCSAWFEYFPNPPIDVLCVIENLISFFDQDLYNHFVRFELTTEIYAWPLLRTGFSEVFTQDEWLCLWDNLLTNPPPFLLHLTAAFLITVRSQLMQLEDAEDLSTLLHTQIVVSVSTVLSHAHHLSASTPKHLQPATILFRQIGQHKQAYQDYGRASLKPHNATNKSAPKSPGFIPLTKPAYPIITKFPKFMVDFQFC